MFCRKCGKEIPDDSDFCPKCGTAVGNEIVNQVNLQKDEAVADVSEINSSSEPLKTEITDTNQTAAIEIKQKKSNKPLVITIIAAVITVVFAAVFIPMAVSKNKETHREFEYQLKADDTYTISKYLGTDLNVVIPDEIDGKPVSKIGDNVFNGSSIESITIGKNVWEIGNSAFSNCRSLRSVEILANDDFIIDMIEGDILINSIGDSAFANCSALETLIFPNNNFTEIGARAFYQCSALKSVELTGIRSVGEKAFSESGLRSVNLHSGETASAVFANCRDLKEVTLGNLVDISDEMFSGCTSLETVTWTFSPYMDNEIGSKAFYGCTSLKKFNTIDTPITYPRGFSDFIANFKDLGAKDVVIAEDAFEGCSEFNKLPLSGSTIAVGTSHTVAVKNNGTVVAIGDNYAGQCNVSNWNDIVFVSAGMEHTVGLKADGTVVATGDNYFGQCNVSGWNNIVSICAGSYHTVGLKADGTVVIAGDTQYGEGNVSSWKDIIAISADSSHTFGVKSDGTVVATGDNYFGECNVSNWRDIVAVSAGDEYTIGLKSNGTVVAIGDNEHNQCNISGWRDIVAISANGYNTIGLKSNGSVVIAGSDYYGLFEAQSWRNIIAIASTYKSVVGLKLDGTVIAVGENSDGQLNVQVWRDIKLPS